MNRALVVRGVCAIALMVARIDVARSEGSFDDTDIAGVVIPYLQERAVEQLEDAGLPQDVIDRLLLPAEERPGVTLVQSGENLRASVRQVGDELLQSIVIVQLGNDVEQNLITGAGSENNQALFFALGQIGASATIVQASAEEVAEQAIDQDSDPAVYEFTPANGVAGDAVVTVTYDDARLSLAYGDAEATLLGGDLQQTDRSAVDNIAVINQGFSVDGITTENGSFFDDADHPQDDGEEPQEALIIQAGEGSLAFISQAGADNDSLILQNGDFNRAKAFQLLADESQTTPGNLSVIAQVGDYNSASVYQIGNGLSSLLLQFGGGNTAVVEQAGTAGASAFIYQSGAEATQYDQGNIASIRQVQASF